MLSKLLLYILPVVLTILGFVGGYIPNKHELLEPILMDGMEKKRLTLAGGIFISIGVLIFVLAIIFCVLQYKNDRRQNENTGIQHSNDSIMWEQHEARIITEFKASLRPFNLDLDSNRNIVRAITNNYTTNNYNGLIKQRNITQDDIYRIKRAFKDKDALIDITYDMAEKEEMNYANSIYNQMKKIGYYKVRITPIQGGNTGMGDVPLFDTIELYYSGSNREIMIHKATKTD